MKSTFSVENKAKLVSINQGKVRRKKKFFTEIPYYYIIYLRLKTPKCLLLYTVISPKFLLPFYWQEETSCKKDTLSMRLPL